MSSKQSIFAALISSFVILLLHQAPPSYALSLRSSSSTNTPTCEAQVDEGPQGDVLCAGATGTGYNGTYECAGQSSGFDDPFTIGSPADYGSLNWAVLHGFTFQNKSANNPIAPITCPNYLRATDGYATVLPGLDYEAPNTISYTTLRAFWYACADPTSHAAVFCSLSMEVTCVNITKAGRVYPHQFSHVFEYEPDHATNASMKAVSLKAMTSILNAAKKNTEEWQVLPRHALNYTLTATQSSGSPAVLFVDNISYNWWYSRG